MSAAAENDLGFGNAPRGLATPAAYARPVNLSNNPNNRPPA